MGTGAAETGFDPPRVRITLILLRSRPGDQAVQQTEWLTTSTMIQRLRSFDDHSVWERFHHRFRVPILAFAHKLGLESDEAEDAAQNVLLAFAETIRGGQYDRQRGSLRKWLFGIAYRQIANARRARHAVNARRDGHGEASGFWHKLPAEEEASGVWDLEWERTLLETCLLQVRSEFADKTYDAFHLIVRAGQTPDQAAALLGMTRDAVYVAKHRVLKRLRQVREEIEGIEPAATDG